MHPNLMLVSMINEMHADGNFIKIVTARGSKSCSTIEERSNKYRYIISEWLKKNGVNYNELSFNKEYGDIYIDDRCYNIKNSIMYKKLDSKFTGNKVRKLNDRVVKRTTSVKDEIRWYNRALEIGLDVPDILSYDSDTISLEFIEGSECYNIDLILGHLKKMKNTKPSNRVNFNSYIERIGIHISNNPNIKNGGLLIKRLSDINPSNTFSHGDFSVHNMIQKENRLFLIDPIYSEEIYQSYVIDAAKHLFTILYYSCNSDFYELCYSEYVSKLGINYKELDILIASESVRVANRKHQIIDISNNLIDSL
jgi:tRNA A-37 threonylcarbamoyl transferase component Bud32